MNRIREFDSFTNEECIFFSGVVSRAGRAFSGREETFLKSFYKVVTGLVKQTSNEKYMASLIRMALEWHMPFYLIELSQNDKDFSRFDALFEKTDGNRGKVRMRISKSGGKAEMSFVYLAVFEREELSGAAAKTEGRRTVFFGTDDLFLPGLVSV